MASVTTMKAATLSTWEEILLEMGLNEVATILPLADPALVKNLEPTLVLIAQTVIKMYPDQFPPIAAQMSLPLSSIGQISR